MTVLGLFHILIIIPCLYFIPKTNFNNLNKSTWGLIALAVVIVLSVLFNQDIASYGYKPIGKAKYFFIGFLAIVPFSYFFKKVATEKKISYLIYTLCISTTIATIAGIVGMKTGFNYISFKAVSLERNAGLSGMVLNYAHNLAFFQIIMIGLIMFRKEIPILINKNFLFAVFAINLIGLYYTYTRGALLALLVGAPFYFFKKHKLKFVGVVVVLVALGASLYFLSGDNIRRPGSDRERISQWQAALKAFEEKPILGYGYLNFEKHSIEIKKRYGISEQHFGGHAHNNFFEIMATTGIIGLLCYLFWLIAWFIEMYKRDDLISRITLPFIVVFVVGGLTQATVSLGVNLFFVMAVYSISQINDRVIKD